MGANSSDPFLRLSTTDGMTETDYTDHLGRKFRVFIKEGGDPSRGIVKGPPVLDALGLDEAATTRLHNALMDRGIITAHDAMRRPQEILGALQQAFRANVQQIQNLYMGIEVAPPAPQPVPQPQPAPQPITPPTPITPVTSESSEEDVTDAR